MVRNNIQWLGAALLLFIVGCGTPQSEANYVTRADVAESAAPASQGREMRNFSVPRAGVASPVASQTASPAAPKMETAALVTIRSVVRKAELSVRVENVEKAEKSLDRQVSEMGGYVDGATSSDLASDKPIMDITVRVPVEHFESALDRFEGLGIRLAKTISSEDVTGQVVDLDARLKTLSAQEETYRGLLRAAHQLNSVIELQDKLVEVRSQLESMTAQRKTLGSLAALSTITVHLEQSAVPIRPSTDPSWLAQTWAESTTNLAGLLRTVASALIWFGVFSPIWIPFLLVIRRTIVVNRAQRPPIPDHSPF